MPYRPPKPKTARPRANSSAEANPLNLPPDFGDYKVAALPIVANFLRKIGVTALVDQKIPSPQNISSGQVVAGMVMDTLSGRSPLYKLHEFFIGQDTQLLFGEELSPTDFNDNNTGKVLDNIHAYGPSKLFSQVAFQACHHQHLDTRFLHYDTTSKRVYGDYRFYAEETEETIAIVHGHSKDKRPDLKQFMIEALCVKGSVPLLGAVLSGNTSDKKANNAELTRVASHLKKHGLDPAAFIYVADSALVTKENLDRLHELKQPFITRLPANYKAEQKAIDEANKKSQWTELGTLAQKPDPSRNRLSARYKIAETTVEIEGRTYRAIVVHSNAHDKRRTRKLDKQLTTQKEAFAKLDKATRREIFACESDAHRRAKALIKSNRFAHHTLKATVEAKPIYARGRPPKGQSRKVTGHRYRIHLQLCENAAHIACLRQRNGCFVLLSNVPAADQPDGLDGATLLRAYKDQNGVEINFGFLKDPVIVNEIFLKKAERIEALGFILLLSLMVWNLIQTSLRGYLEEHNKTILGWDNKQTHRPTTLMVIFYFQHVSIFRWDEGRKRQLSRPLLKHQKDYLDALGLPESIFVTPVPLTLPPKAEGRPKKINPESSKW